MTNSLPTLSSSSPAARRPPAQTSAALLACPECGQRAQIVDRFTLAGAPHPVEHVKIICVAGHWFTDPIDRL